MVGYDKESVVQLSQIEYLIAGAAAGVLSRFISQPLDVLKVRFQLQVEPISAAADKSKYRSFGQAVKVILKEEGARGLWSGHLSGQLLSVSYSAVNFAAFEWLTELCQERLSLKKSPQTNFGCGMASGALATVVSYPFDVLRTRFIVQGARHSSAHMARAKYERAAKLGYALRQKWMNRRTAYGRRTLQFWILETYQSMSSGLAKMVRNEGFSAPYKGLLPSLLQNAPMVGVSFTTHNIIKSILDKIDSFSNSSNRLNVTGNLIAGGVAGFTSKTVIYPLDLARRRLQFQGFQKARVGFGSNFNCWGLVDCIRSTVAKEGVRGLFKGYVPSIVKTSLSTSVYFTLYEEIVDIIAYLHA